MTTNIPIQQIPFPVFCFRGQNERTKQALVTQIPSPLSIIQPQPALTSSFCFRVVFFLDITG